MKTYDTILKRRSIRRFQPKPIPYPVLEKMVNAGRLAPSAANLQPCLFLIVDDAALVKEVFATLRWAAYITPAGNPPKDKTPVAYIVILIDQKVGSAYAAVDAAAAAENILLAGLEEGVAGCWLGSVDRPRLAQTLQIPERYRIESVLALGYPAQESYVEEFAGSVKYWLDEAGNLHIPKRSLKEVLRHNTLKEKS